MTIRARYQGIIRDIMRDNDVSLLYQPGYVVPQDAGLNEVLQYTDFYVGQGNDTQPNAQQHYRYRRYQELLSTVEPSGQREALVDLGCGAGLFSWVFLDWATQKGVALDDVDLYGLDRSLAMICLAREIRARLVHHILRYPELHYSRELKGLLRKLRDNHQRRTDYTITFGHVLAQAHTPDDVSAFVRAIVNILKLMGGGSNCKILAVDARSASISFAAGWSALLHSLESANIRYEEQEVRTTPINDNECAKVALLCQGG